MTELNDIVDTAKAAFLQADTPADLENAKALYLGKSGRMTELMKGLAVLSVEEKKTRGAAINVAKQAIEAALNARRLALAEAELQAQLKAEGFTKNSGGIFNKTVTGEGLVSRLNLYYFKSPEKTRAFLWQLNPTYQLYAVAATIKTNPPTKVTLPHLDLSFSANELPKNPVGELKP